MINSVGLGGLRLVPTPPPATVPAAVLEQLLDASPVAMALIDADELLVYANPACCRLLGHLRADLLGRPAAELTDLEFTDPESGRPGVWDERCVVRPDGQLRWVRVESTVVPGPGGHRWTLLTITDTTGQRRTERAWRDAAHTDSLTGLLNRRGWNHALHQLLGADDDAPPLTVALLDLDHFKAYNDTHGHPAGDQLLRDFAAAAARSAQRHADVLTRWGGDEFALALPHCDSSDAHQVLTRIAAMLPAGQTLSAGHSTLRPGEDLNTCLRRVDTLLYDAKSHGRKRITAGTDTDTDQVRAADDGADTARDGAVVVDLHRTRPPRTPPLRSR